MALGLCLVDKMKRVESFSLIFEVLDSFDHGDKSNTPYKITAFSV